MKHHANSKVKIMVVEDDEQASTFMAAALREHGYEPIVICDSCQVIHVAESHIPHAFLLDLTMPPPDGFRLCRMLRGHRRFKDTPILIITSLNQMDSRIVAIGAGATSYLVKPFHADELIFVVNGLFG